MWQPQGFYNQYVLHQPIILSGNESVRGLYNYPAAKIAVIHGNSFKDKKIFEETFIKRDIRFIKRSWENEPDIEGLKGTIKELEEYRPDTIIAVGGGSVIDGSKLCRFFYEFPYYSFNETRISGELFKTKFIAIPTTVGSGAEVSSAAVFVEKTKKKKDMVVIHELQPEVVVYDANYIANAPKKFLVMSIMDAMAHILEGYVSKIDNSVMDILAEKALSMINIELSNVLRGLDIDYQKLQYIGYIGGLVQNHCIVGAAHAVAHQLTEYGYSHCEAVAHLLVAVIRLNSINEVAKKRYERIANLAGFSSLNELLKFIEELCVYTEIDKTKENLKSLLLERVNDIEFCDNVKSDKGGKGNPVEITDDYICQLVRSI